MFRGVLCILFLQLFHQIQPQTLRTCFLSPRPTSVCDPTERYRTITGSCNNIDNPTWGMPGSQLHRLVSSAYSDGIGEPRGGYNSRTLPNPRYLSQRNHPDNDNPDTRFTHMVMQFGQFLDHDITVTPKDETLDCCKDTTNDSKCFIIQIPPRDRFYSWVNHTVTCLNLVRSTPLCQTPQREQYNGITSYIDASTVYGSEVGHAAFIRKYEGGELMENDVTGQLPTKEQLNLRPDINRLRKERQIDFVSGDERTNEHPFLTSMHIVFLREHNRIARELRKHLPTYLQQDEFIYQESRRLVGAQMQNIVYGEFLPTILGAKYMKKYNLLAEDSSQYDPRENPSVIHAFTVAAFRFGHSMINSMFMLKSGKHDSTDPHTFFWRLREIFDGQTVGGSRLPLENMLEGLCSQMPQTVDPFFSTEITNHLFQKNKKQENFGQDLLAINVQRGRDHGIPGYNAYRKYCGLSPMTDWTNKPSELSEEYWLQLKDVYDKVDDIDLMVGGVAETNVKGGAVGPTFACIIGEQFKKLKYGDRFFYTHQPDSYHSKGLSAVSKSYVLERTLGDILCENSEIAEVQQWVTLQPDNQFNKMELCSSRANFVYVSGALQYLD
ncbi:chorion peroxidase isoform X2 [Eurytemora carolleeae]|uniref:chorion peroxidase isoform X2 n=1 Tax=Eurytemora carolleeae TaxID=1294199 RepID=UPI000C765407|nr:chorion peroxidase isoform X2 [Eurytemora carolleeae]|eukprot:XP_023338409.1 chorion peroxidase-like isoform X2 [Eurytemora affinis]